jgi:hypothetical protein
MMSKVHCDDLEDEHSDSVQPDDQDQSLEIHSHPSLDEQMIHDSRLEPLDDESADFGGEPEPKDNWLQFQSAGT